MVTAVETRPGTNPDRASFTTALEAARDQLTAAHGICPTGPADLPGSIGRAVLSTLLPARRQRVTVLMSTDPHRAWSGQEPATRLQTKPHNLPGDGTGVSCLIGVAKAGD